MTVGVQRPLVSKTRQICSAARHKIAPQRPHESVSTAQLARGVGVQRPLVSVGVHRPFASKIGQIWLVARLFALQRTPRNLLDRRQLFLPAVLPHHGMLPGRACKIIVRIFGVRLAENESTGFGGAPLLDASLERSQLLIRKCTRHFTLKTTEEFLGGV